MRYDEQHRPIHWVNDPEAFDTFILFILGAFFTLSLLFLDWVCMNF